MIPIILIAGKAGAGKDTITSFLVKNHGAQAIAFADPMKRFALHAFEFTEPQLWGPTEERERIDTRFADYKFCNKILDNVSGDKLSDPGWKDLNAGGVHFAKLKNWAFGLLKDAQKQGGLTPRKMLQTLGTEWGRSVSPNMWVERAIMTAKDILHFGYQYDRTIGITERKGSTDLVVISDGRFRNEILTVRELGGEVWKVISEINAEATSSAGLPNHQSETEQQHIPDDYFNAVLHNDKSAGLKAAEAMVNSVMYDYWAQRKPAWHSAKVAALRGW